MLLRYPVAPSGTGDHAREEQTMGATPGPAQVNNSRVSRSFVSENSMALALNCLKAADGSVGREVAETDVPPQTHEDRPAAVSTRTGALLRDRWGYYHFSSNQDSLMKFRIRT